MSRFLKYVLWSVIGLIVLQGIVAKDNGPLTAMFGDRGVYYLLLCDVWALVAILLMIWIVEARKLQRMRARYEHIKTLKGQELVKYLTESGWGKK